MGNMSISLDPYFVQKPFVCPSSSHHVIPLAMRRSWLALGVGVPVVIAGALLVRHTLRAEGPHAPSIAKLSGPAAAAVLKEKGMDKPGS